MKKIKEKQKTIIELISQYKAIEKEYSNVFQFGVNCEVEKKLCSLLMENITINKARKALLCKKVVRKSKEGPYYVMCKTGTSENKTSKWIINSKKFEIGMDKLVLSKQ